MLPSHRAIVLDLRHAAEQAVELLQSGDADLMAKAAAARKLGLDSCSLQARCPFYTTEKETSEQFKSAQEEAEFDRRTWDEQHRHRQQQEGPA